MDDAKEELKTRKEEGEELEQTLYDELTRMFEKDLKEHT